MFKFYEKFKLINKFRKYNLIMLVYIYSCAIKLVLLYHTCILALMKHNVYKYKLIKEV